MSFAALDFRIEARDGKAFKMSAELAEDERLERNIAVRAKEPRPRARRSNPAPTRKFVE